MPAGGGTIERLIAARGVRFPELLPGGRAILFNVSDLQGGFDVAMETLDTHERTMLVRDGTFPRFVTSGHLVFARSGKLMAVAFDPVTRTTSGDPVVVGEDVMLSEGGGAYFRENRNRAVCRVTFRQPRVRAWGRLRGAETCPHARRSEGCRDAAAGFPREHARSYDLA